MLRGWTTTVHANPSNECQNPFPFSGQFGSSELLSPYHPMAHISYPAPRRSVCLTMLFTKFNVLRSALQQRGFVSPGNRSFSIPVINFNKFRQASSPDEKRHIAGDIVSAFKQSGFVYLSNHGIDQCECLERAASVSK